MKSFNDNSSCEKAYKIIKGKDNYLELMKGNNKALDSIEKALDKFLGQKREIFTRFFFLSNDELLLILAQGGSNIFAVQPHLRKCFENIAKFETKDESNMEIKTVVSAEGEVLRLGQTVKTKDNVEKWMDNLSKASCLAVRKALQIASSEAEKDEDN